MNRLKRHTLQVRRFLSARSGLVLSLLQRTDCRTALLLITCISVQMWAPHAAAQSGPGMGVAAGDRRLYEAAQRLFLLVEGNFGALIMVCAGLASIIAAAFNQYRKAFSLLIVATGAFILRSLVVIFFNFK